MGTTSSTKPASWKQAKESGTALFSWRRSIGLSRATFAQLVNFSERSLATFEKEKELPETVRPQVTEAVRLVQALCEIVPADELSKWLETPNPGFGGKRPWTLIQNGERDLVWEMIHQTRQGAFA